jgi:hypothetical protein
VLRSSLVVRITGWYGWLLVVLVLAFGAYTCKCLDNCLSIGVENELSIRAKEIAGMFAKTGQMPVREGPFRPGLNDPLISVQQSGGSAPAFSGKPETQAVAPSNLRREPNSLAVPTRVVRRAAHDSSLQRHIRRSETRNTWSRWKCLSNRSVLSSAKLRS